jgi:hypothetical protein
MIVYRMDRLPDFTSARYTSLHGEGVRERALECQGDFLMWLHSLEFEGGDIGVSLRYLYEPGAPPGRRMSIFLLLRNDLGFDDEKLAGIVENSPLATFFPFDSRERGRGGFRRLDPKETAPIAGLGGEFPCAVEIIKEEALFEPTFDPAETSLRDSIFKVVPYYTVYPFEPKPDNDMVFLDALLTSFDRRAMVEVTLSPCRISNEESAAITKVLSELEKVTSASTFSISTSLGETGGSRKDTLAEMVQDQVNEMQEAAFTGRFFDFCIRVFTEDEIHAAAIADRLAIAGNGNGHYRKFVLDREDERFKPVVEASREVRTDSGLLWAEYWDRVPPEFETLLRLRRLCRVAEREEASAFFRLLVPGMEPLQSIPLESEYNVEEGAKAIHVGQDFFKPHRSVEIAVEQLKKHVFIAGVPGSGKSTAALNLLYQLHRHGIPFLVIEPAKTEYRLLKRLAKMAVPRRKRNDPAREQDEAGRHLGQALRVYSVGEEVVSPFRFNPFEFPEGIGLYEHMANVDACFRGALPISFGPLPALIGEAMEAIYRDRGWTGDDVADGSKPFPTMKDLYEKIGEIFESKEYSGEVRGNLKTAIEVRIGTLLRRNIGRIFDTESSSPDIETLMSGPVVLELDYLNEEQANLMTMFVLARIREYVRATRTSKSPLRHVIVLEEAHNIIGKTDSKGGEDQADPKAEATKYVSRFLAEMRALGEGMIIADQLPSAVAPEVVKNTNIKLIHRLVSGDDREDIGLTMLMDPVQMKDLARLLPGESYLFQEGMQKPCKVREVYLAERFPVLEEAPPTHLELIGMLEEEAWWREGVLGEVRGIVSAWETLFGELSTRFSKIEGRRHAQEGGSELEEEARDLKERLDAWAARIRGIENGEASSLRLMMRRSHGCYLEALDLMKGLDDMKKEIDKLIGRLQRVRRSLNRRLEG